jgi:hypothetical protein
VRIIATTDTLRREIVFNPGSGEILRDLATLLPTTEPPVPVPRHHSSDAGDDPVATATVVGDPPALDAADAERLDDALILPESVVTLSPEEDP